jgi:hypothetical protein
VSDRRGHIKLSRKFFEEDPWWNEKRPRTRAEAWLDVLYLASFRARKYATKYGIIELDRGQFVASRRHLADRWHWGEKAVRNFLEVCQKWDRIRAQRETQAGTIYQIVNYDYYQATGPTEEPLRGPVEGPPRAHLGPKREAVKQVSSYTTVIRQAADLWAASRGKPSYPRIGKAMKELVPAHGARQVLVVWGGYLEDRRQSGFCNPEDFVGQYEFYRRKWGIEIGEDGTEHPIPDEPVAA